MKRITLALLLGCLSLSGCYDGNRFYGRSDYDYPSDHYGRYNYRDYYYRDDYTPAWRRHRHYDDDYYDRRDDYWEDRYRR